MEISEIYSELKTLLLAQCPPLKVRKDEDGHFEVAGTREAMQGKQKVNGYYFASVVMKPKDVRFYFFPIYTHVKDYEDIPDDVRKMLKGKSCFHIKKMNNDQKEIIKSMIQKGVELYKNNQLI